MIKLNKLKPAGCAILTALIILLVIITQTGCGQKPINKTTYALDTVCEITIYDMEEMDEKKAMDAINGAFSLCNEYENLLSKTRENSDIYRINHSKGKAVNCDKRTIDVVKRGMHYGELSNGKFDITIGKVSDLWDFHSDEPKLPSGESLVKALTAVDYRNITIRGNTVKLTNPDSQIDLGGIAKGYIGDKMGQYLEKSGVKSAVISLGGNIITLGDKGGEDFNIGIEKPYSDMRKIVGSVRVSNATVVTSGIYERFIEVKGKKYHHVLSVETGYPVNTDLEGVTLISSKGRSVDCDALSTTCLILGVEKGRTLVESMDGVEGVFIDKKGNITKTKGCNFKKE